MKFHSGLISSKQMEAEVGQKVFEAVRTGLEERLDILVEDILATIRYRYERRL